MVLFFGFVWCLFDNHGITNLDSGHVVFCSSMSVPTPGLFPVLDTVLHKGLLFLAASYSAFFDQLSTFMASCKRSATSLRLDVRRNSSSSAISGSFFGQECRSHCFVLRKYKHL